MGTLYIAISDNGGILLVHFFRNDLLKKNYATGIIPRDIILVLINLGAKSTCETRLRDLH